MATSKTMDLEKELTCSICTELLYQPLTLLDCLHTFCGACLQEWFSFQAEAAETSPTPPPADKPVFTCPSCRDAVRSTRHNATVATLLDMLLTAQPEKQRAAAERAEMDAKYRPGDNVLPTLRLRRSAEQRRRDEEDRRLVDEVRALSRQEAVGGAGPAGPARRRRSASRSAADPGASRGMGHQSSLRSLISQSGQGTLDMEREIEAFARQIQEEGILDGLDLDNIDLSNDDELSRRIAEAYQRRQRGRSRPDGGRRSNASNTSRHSDVSQLSDTSRQSNTSRVSQVSRLSDASQPAPRTTSQTRTTSRPRTASRPRSPPPAHLEVSQLRQHQRRRTSSEGRSTSLPMVHSSEAPRPGARSQTDLSLRPREDAPIAELDAASATTSQLPFRERASALGLPSLDAKPNRKRANEAPAAPVAPPPPPPQAPIELPSSPTVVTSPVVFSDSFDRTPLSPPSSVSSFASQTAVQPAHQRKRSLLYPEPSIACAGCGRAHIEYTLHYNCAVCSQGAWNICLDCYRRGRGCQHWFGFGYAAWQRWEQAAARHKQEAGAGAEALAPPHMLTANRYMQPRTTPGGADGRRTLTNDDPQTRLQSGVFCAGCLAWANSCYWRCDVCNDGDWGFCDACVDQGRACTHALLPLAHQSSTVFGGGGADAVPAPPAPPRSARPLDVARGAGRGAAQKTPHIGSFRPLTFVATCDMCRRDIEPLRPRFHCYVCHRSAETGDGHEAEAGDYDLCEGCYATGTLVGGCNIATQNGPAGWRRCPAGHRMAVVAFQEDRAGMRRRVVLQAVVGGWRLRTEAAAGLDGAAALQTWYLSFGQERRYVRLVAEDVRVEAPPPLPAVAAARTAAGERPFPPSGGLGQIAVARWAWIPEAGADDELPFPKGAEIREVEDVNGEWFSGTYMGRQGLFPGGYVRITGETT